MEWYNKPENWSCDDDGKIVVHVPPKTDFWRVTLHGFIKDDAPFYYKEVEGDFEATVKFTGNYAALYDQAGMMVRLNEKVWMKCGIEYYQQVQHASTVITRDFSDWSILPVHADDVAAPSAVWFKVKRTKECIETFYSTNGGNTYTQIRQGYLTEETKLQVGITAAAPTGDGFEAIFEDFDVSS